MAVSDAARNRLYNTIRENFGPEDADTMMELLPPVGWSDVARQRDLERVEARLDRLETKVDAMSTRIIGSMLAFGTVQTAVVGLLVSLD